MGNPINFLKDPNSQGLKEPGVFVPVVIFQVGKWREIILFFREYKSSDIDNSLRIGNLDFATSLQANGGCV